MLNRWLRIYRVPTSSGKHGKHGNFQTLWKTGKTQGIWEKNGNSGKTQGISSWLVLSIKYFNFFLALLEIISLTYYIFASAKVAVDKIFLEISNSLREISGKTQGNLFSEICGNPVVVFNNITIWFWENRENPMCTL